MPTLYNISAQYVLPVGHSGLAIAPGASHEFTDEEAASAGVEWSSTAPREGLAAEKEFKAKRDKSEASPAPENTESGDTKESSL